MSLGRRIRTQADVDQEQQEFKNSCQRAAHRMGSSIKLALGDDWWNNLSVDQQELLKAYWATIIHSELS